MLTDKNYGETKLFGDMRINNIVWATSTNFDTILPKNELQTKQPITVIDLGKMLLQSAKEGDVGKVRKLIARGAPFTSDWLGMTALHFAAMNNNYEICEILLRGGINKDAKTKVDRTPLHFAVFEGHELIVELLLTKKCDVNARDMLRMTALHWAVEKQLKSIVRLLLKYNADPTVISKFDKSPMSLAVQTCQPDLLHELETARHIQKTAATLLEDLQHQTQSETNQAVNSIAFDSHTNSNFDLTTSLIENDEMDDITNNDNSMSINNAPNSPASNHFIDSNSNSNMDDDESMSFVEPIVQLQNLDDTKQLDASALELLKNHGISMLPIDEPENNLLTSALQSGRKLVLSEAGKLVLNETKLKKSENNNSQIFESNMNPSKPVKKQPIFVRTAKGMQIKQNKNVKIITMDMFKQMYGGDVANSLKKIQPFSTNNKSQNNFSTINSQQIPKITKLIANNGAEKKTIISKVCVKHPSQLIQTETVRKHSSNSMQIDDNYDLPPNIIEVYSDTDLEDEMHENPFINKNKIQKCLPQILKPAVTISRKLQSVTTTRTFPAAPTTTTTTIVPTMDITEISRQLLELRKQTEDLQKQLELSQKQSEEYKTRLERLENEKDLVNLHSNDYNYK